MTRRYEVVYIFDSALEDAAIQEKLGRFHGLLSTKGDIALDLWKTRQLAYKIGTRDTGYYVVARFEAEPAGLPEFERALKLDDGVVRYLVTVHEHEVGAPVLSEEEMASARRQDEDEDED